MEGPLLEHFDEFAEVARVGDQRHVRALADGQQTQRERKDVIQRQGGDRVDLAQVAHALERRVEPGFGLQHGGHDVAVGQDGAFGQAGGATGVLQKGDVVHVLRRGLEREAVTLGHGLAPGRDGTAFVQRQFEFGHQLGQVAHGKGHPAAVDRPQHVAQCGHHGVADLRVCDDFLQGVGEVLEDDDGDGARILELVFELASGVERVDVDAGVAGPNHGRHGHGELRQVGQHDGHPAAGLQPLSLQPGAQSSRVLVQITVSHPAVHTDRERVVGMFAEGAFQNVGQRAVLLGMDVVGNTWGVALEPDFFHAECLLWMPLCAKKRTTVLRKSPQCRC